MEVERTKSALRQEPVSKSVVISFQVVEYSFLNSWTTSNTEPLLASSLLSVETYTGNMSRAYLCPSTCRSITLSYHEQQQQQKHRSVVNI